MLRKLNFNNVLDQFVDRLMRKNLVARYICMPIYVYSTVLVF